MVSVEFFIVVNEKRETWDRTRDIQLGKLDRN